MQEKPNYGKAIGGAALVGGLLGVLGMALVMIFGMTPLYSQGLSIFFVLGALGLIGAILYLCNIYPKLEAFGGMGAVLPICGLVAAVAGATFGVGKATGSYAKGAKVAIVDLLVKIVLVATAICCVVGAFIYFTDIGSVFTAPYAPAGLVVEQVGPPNGTADGPPMGIPVGIDPLAFLWAFIVVAVIAAVAQAILMLTKIPMPAYLITLLAVGGVLTPLGLMKATVLFGGGGFQVLIIDAGEAIVSTFYAFLSGNYMPFLLVLCLFVYLFAVGILAGFIKMAMTKGKDAPDEPGAEQSAEQSE